MIGQTLKHYKIEALLGKGGMGVVYRALDVRLQRPVALKMLTPSLVSDPDRRTRFLREAQSAAALTHPAIAQVYDIDEADGGIFIAMEYVDGKTVSRLIADGELDLMGSVEIAFQVAEGLHKKIVPEIHFPIFKAQRAGKWDGRHQLCSTVCRSTHPDRPSATLPLMFSLERNPGFIYRRVFICARAFVRGHP